MTPVFRQKIDKTIPAWIFALAELESCKFAAFWVIALMVADDFFWHRKKPWCQAGQLASKMQVPLGEDLMIKTTVPGVD